MTDAITRLHNPHTGQTLSFLTSADETGGRYLELESRWRPHSAEPAAHYHPHQTETFTVLEGALTVRLNGRLHELNAGDQLVIRPNEVHSMWNASDADTVVNWRTEPALRTEEFLRTIFGLAHDGHANSPDGTPGLLQAALTLRRHIDEFRLAKPPYAVQRAVFGALGAVARWRGMQAVYARYQRPAAG